MVVCLVSLPTRPLTKIQPLWSPIGSQSDAVRSRASARITPMSNNVAKAASNIIGSANCENDFATDSNPEAHVTIGLERSGAFRKWIVPKKAEVMKAARKGREARRRIPRMSPRKNASSISGTATAAAVTEVVLGHTSCGSPWSGVTSFSYSRSRGYTRKKNPPSASCIFARKSASHFASCSRSLFPSPLSGRPRLSRSPAPGKLSAAKTR